MCAHRGPRSGPERPDPAHARDPAPLVCIIPGIAAEVNKMVPVTLLRAHARRLSNRKRARSRPSVPLRRATTLAAASMIAMVAFTVAQRKRELGIRMALGAGARYILEVHVRPNARPATAGAVAGVILAVILLRLDRSQIVLQKQYTVEVLDFAARFACLELVAVPATESPAEI